MRCAMPIFSIYVLSEGELRHQAGFNQNCVIARTWHTMSEWNLETSKAHTKYWPLCIPHSPRMNCIINSLNTDYRILHACSNIYYSYRRLCRYNAKLGVLLQCLCGGIACVKSCCFNGIVHQTCVTIPSRNQALFTFYAGICLCSNLANVHCAYTNTEIPSGILNKQQHLDSSYVASTRWITLIIYLYKSFGRFGARGVIQTYLQFFL